jgi:hypothetical protein
LANFYGDGYVAISKRKLLISHTVRSVQRAIDVTLSYLGPYACRLDAAWPDDKSEAVFQASDFYACLAAFRRTIEPEGYRVARPNVFPSAMARQAGGWKAYAVSMGEYPDMCDLVNIFDPVSTIEMVGTVEEQDEFRRRHNEIIRSHLPVK